MACTWRQNAILTEEAGKALNCSIATKIATLVATLKADDEIKVRRRIFTFKTLIYV